MLWTAGHERMTRERDDRLAELFVAARDAEMDVGVTTGHLKPVGSWKLPSYIVTTDEPPVIRSPAVRDAALMKLNAMFPGIVRRADS